MTNSSKRKQDITICETTTISETEERIMDNFPVDLEEFFSTYPEVAQPSVQILVQNGKLPMFFFEDL